MTRAERRKLAKAARELAYEFAEGRGPKISNAGGWCNCAAGQVVRRAFSYSDREMVDRWERAALIEYNVLTLATAEQAGLGVFGAVVFPLLYVADELESRR